MSTYRYDSPEWRALARWVTATGRCVVCGTTDDLVAHHKIPRSHGGPDTYENAEPVCRQHHPLRELIAKLAAERAGLQPVGRFEQALQAITRPRRRVSRRAVRAARRRRAVT